MEQIVVLKYIDALYYDQDIKTPDFNGFQEHVAIGKIFANKKDCVAISFSEREGKPIKGLFLPKGSLILSENDKKNKDTEIRKQSSRFKKGNAVGIYWIDITYFDNGQVPGSCTSMYTEGKIFSFDERALVIKNPQTLKIKGGKVSSHPKYEYEDYVSFCAIPWSLITNLQNYDSP